MSTGISHHVSPRGDIEPCPIIQFATENIRDARGVYETITTAPSSKTSARPPRSTPAAASCWSAPTS